MTWIAAKNHDIDFLIASFSLRSVDALLRMVLVVVLVVVVVVVVVAAAAVMLYPLVTQPSLQKLRSFFSELQS